MNKIKNLKSPLIISSIKEKSAHVQALWMDISCLAPSPSCISLWSRRLTRIGSSKSGMQGTKKIKSAVSFVAAPPLCGTKPRTRAGDDKGALYVSPLGHPTTGMQQKFLINF